MIPDNIKEEIEKEAQEYAASLKISHDWEMRLGDVTVDGDGKLVTFQSVFTQAATKFYERGMQELKAERRRAFEAGADVEGYADNYGEEIGVTRTFETFESYEKSLEGEK